MEVPALGEILVLHALKVMRRDQQTLPILQPRDRFLQAISQFDVGKLSIRTRRRDRGGSFVIERYRNRRARWRSHAHVGDDAVDPCGKARFASKIRQAAVDPQKDLLREILGAVMELRYFLPTIVIVLIPIVAIIGGNVGRDRINYLERQGP